MDTRAADLERLGISSAVEPVWTLEPALILLLLVDLSDFTPVRTAKASLSGDCEP